MAKTGAQWNFQDKNQRVSRVNSEFLRNSISQHMCQDGSVNLPSQEVDAIIRNLSRKEKKISKMWWALGFAAIFSVALFALTFASALSANEASKESHVDASNLVDLDGNVVATQQLESYGSLFDLATFDIDTLKHVKSVTAVFHGGIEMNFNIANVMKCPGGSQVTFIASDGSKVIIDRESRVASAHVDDDILFVDMSQDVDLNRRLSEETSRLYTKEEFFTAENGFSGRTLSADNGIGGYAALSLRVSEEVIDEAELAGIDADSFLISGTIKKESQSAWTYQMFVNEDGKRMTEIQKGSGTFVYDFINVESGADYLFHEGVLAQCHMQPNGVAEAVAEMDDTIKHGMQRSCGQRIFSTIDSNGQVTLMEVNHVEVGAENPIVVPTLGECMQLRDAIESGDVDPSHARRLREQFGGATTVAEGRELMGVQGNDARLLYDFYKLKDQNSGTYHGKTGTWSVVACTTSEGNTQDYQGNWFAGKSHGVVATRSDGVTVAAFEGTDPLQCEDWWDNSNNNPITVGGKTFHKGFYNQQHRISGCMNANGGNTAQYIAGHSLGGAAATIYSQLHNTNGQLVTFGAPRTRFHAQCSRGGTRIYHESDPIASAGLGGGWWQSISGAMLNWIVDVACDIPQLDFGSIRHDVSNAVKIVEGCTLLDSAWGCDSIAYNLRSSECEATTHAGHDATWHFALTHTAYALMLDTDMWRPWWTSGIQETRDCNAVCNYGRNHCWLEGCGWFCVRHRCEWRRDCGSWQNQCGCGC